MKSFPKRIGIGVVAVALSSGLSLTAPAASAVATPPTAAAHAAACTDCGGYWRTYYWSDAAHTTLVGERGCFPEENWGVSSAYSSRVFIYSDC